jgi:hypothetical protein
MDRLSPDLSHNEKEKTGREKRGKKGLLINQREPLTRIRLLRDILHAATPNRCCHHLAGILEAESLEGRKSFVGN